MRTGTIISGIGIIMFIAGLVAFYSIQDTQDEFFRSIKHTGTFVGLMGIGVTVAGILLYLTYKSNPEQEHTFGL